MHHRTYVTTTKIPQSTDEQGKKNMVTIAAATLEFFFFPPILLLTLPIACERHQKKNW
jgi:hypothetical protein